MRIATLGLIVSTSPMFAQEPAPYTLHVYTNLIQIPTLVLDSNFKPLPPIPLKDFNISLDEGPKFHPSQVHLEGDDSINLAILLDASGGEEALLNHFADSLASLAPSILHPQDHFSVFAIDCDLVKTQPDIPVSAEALHSAVSKTLAYPTLHGKRSSSSCADKVQLWDAIVKITQTLSTLPGRRVLLLVSTGADHQSHAAVSDVSTFALLHSVTIFGMNDFFNFQSASDVMHQFARNGMNGSLNILSHGDPYKGLCERNGGMLFATRPQDLTRDLQSFISLLRGRYIVEFPRADTSTPGIHGIEITVNRPDVFIVTTGATVPLPNPQVLADPNTVPSTPSQATFGKKRPTTDPTH
jgi:hypothetical protein